MGKYEWFGGVVTPLITPLTEDERFDKASFRRLLGTQVKNNVHSLFILGSSGEGPMLTSRVRKEVVEQTVKFLDGKLPILAGVMGNSVALVLENLRELEGTGVKAGVVTLPYYGWQEDRESAVKFFLTVADKSPIPIVSYNLPRAVGSELNLEIVERLFDHPNIAGIKDSGNNIKEMLRIVKSPARPAHFKFLVGNSILAKETLLSGADGMVSVHSNIFPELVVDFYNSARSRNLKRVENLQECMNELQKILRYPNIPGGIKCALYILGICGKHTINPWPQADKQHESEIKQIITRVKEMYLKQ